jgi:hypothetical protein
MNAYAIDLSLKPTVFDFWHVCLAGAVLLLLLFIIVGMVISFIHCHRKSAVSQPESTAEPIVKIVEVEKIVHAPAPEPVILTEASPDAALLLLSLLQKEARFIDFIKEDITAFSDTDIGIAARVVHEGCNKAINEHLVLAAVRSEQEGSRIMLQDGFDASEVRLTGNIIGNAPFTGTLVHKGWQVTSIKLPKLISGHNAAIIAPAEVAL